MKTQKQSPLAPSWDTRAYDSLLLALSTGIAPLHELHQQAIERLEPTEQDM